VRLIADENVTGTVIETLRHRGHDVLAVKESLRSQPDEAILARAQAEQRILITHDKDFGELAYRTRLPASGGVILFRLSGSSSSVDNTRMTQVLESRTDWAGHFSVITDDKIRMRPLR